MYDTIKQLVDEAQRIVVVQPENPDADSLASSVALEEIFGELGKDVTMFCAIDMPKYLHYVEGWSRVTKDWTGKYDLAVIIDTVADALLVKTRQTPGFNHFCDTQTVLVLDHHNEGDVDEDSLAFKHTSYVDEASASMSELIFQIAQTYDWPLNKTAADAMLTSILGDTLGLSTPSVTERTVQTVVELMKLGAHPSEIEQKRREYMKKPAEILTYKGHLIERIEYHCDGRLALVHIPWEDIERYSDRYNPSILVLDEMRLVEGVDVAIAIKTYPDKKLTGKIRSNLPIADTIASFFGGGGHSHSAGYKIYEEYDTACHELVGAVDKILMDYDKNAKDI